MRKNIHIPDDLLIEIEEWRHENRYKSETAAIVDLITIGLSSGDQGFVYLAEAKDGLSFKIGYSKNPQNRVTALRSPTGSGCTIKSLLVGNRRLERIAHLTWADHKIEGEWFNSSPKISDWFSNHPKQIENMEGLTVKQDGVCFVPLDEEQSALIQAACDRYGLTEVQFLRYAAITYAENMGLRQKQPQAD